MSTETVLIVTETHQLKQATATQPGSGVIHPELCQYSLHSRQPADAVVRFVVVFFNLYSLFLFVCCCCFVCLFVLLMVVFCLLFVVVVVCFL